MNYYFILLLLLSLSPVGNHHVVVLADETFNRAPSNTNKQSTAEKSSSKHSRRKTQDDPFEHGSPNISALFVTRKPRDIFEGVRAAVTNIVRGCFYGVSGLLASPLTGGLSGGVTGLIIGTVTGVFLGVSMPLFGIILSGYQLTQGAISTPEAVKGFIDCKMFDELTRTWREYSLDDDIEEIQSAIKAEKTQMNNISGRRVKDTEYYDLLDLSTDASSSEVRAAYRKKAREVHPDKVDLSMRDAAEKQFREISTAYKTLSNPDSRVRYDNSGVGSDGGIVNALDPYVFFSVLFGSENVEQYVGDLSVSDRILYALLELLAV